MPGASPEKSPAPAVTHAVEILKLLAAESPKWLGVSEIARRLGVSKASTHRFLHALWAGNLVLRHPTTISYTLGPTLVELGAKAAGEGPALQLVREELTGLASSSGMRSEAYQMASDGALLCVASCASPGPISLSRPVGLMVPAMPPIGHIHLAWSPEEAASPHYETLALSKYFAEDLELIRKKGYAWAMAAGENTPKNLAEIVRWLDDAAEAGLARRTIEGRKAQVREIMRFTERRHSPADARIRAMLPTIAIAAPVFDHNGDVRLRLVVVSLLAQVRPDQLDHVGGLVRAAGERVTAATGGRPPKAFSVAIGAEKDPRGRKAPSRSRQ